MNEIENIKSEPADNTNADTSPLNIKSAFFAKDRLDELDEIPKLPNGETDYWLAGKLLCEKDGGRLPTMEELGKLGEWLYTNDKGEHPKIGAYDDIDVRDYTFDIEKAKSIGLKNWDGSEIGGGYVNVYLWSSVEDSSDSAYERGFYTDCAFWYGYGRDGANNQVLCLE